MSAPAKIVVRDLRKSYGATEAVRGVSFAVESGTVFGLLGPNGAGKTSVVECLLGLRQPDGGLIQIEGRIGAALQSTALQDRITPREALDLFGAFYPDAVPVGELLSRFSLVEKADAAFETLSTGQRQRLALALAFVNRPAVLCLDEPTAGLDVPTKRELHEFIRGLRAEGCAILLTTHDLAEAHVLCDQIAVLDTGHIVAEGPPAELISQSRVHPRLVLRTTAVLDAVALNALPEVGSVEVSGTETRLEVERVAPAVVAVVRWLETQGGELLELRVIQPSLEDAVLELTGGPRAPESR